MESASLRSTLSDSSKTASSEEKHSIQGGHRDLLNDNSVSPVDLECLIQTERITKLLDLSIYKTKVALCLPLLMRDHKILATFLKPQDLQEVAFIFDQYDNPLFSTSLMNMAAMEEIQSGDVTMKHRLNPELGHVLYIMNSYKKLKPVIEEMIQQIKIDATEDGEQKASSVPGGFSYLLKLEHFRDLMIARLETTAAEQLETKFRTIKLEDSNQRLVAEINERTETLNEEHEQFLATMKVKNDSIQLLEYDVMGMRQAATSALDKLVLDSDRQMVLLSRAHEVRGRMLKEDEMETCEMYDRILKKDLLQEKTHRQRRNKVETQLLSWIQKYDLEMKDKQVEMDQLTENYDEEEELVRNLEIKLKEQDKQYDPLMKEREEEYHAELKEKMEKALIEHAARVIQVAWRDTLANRAEKKKLKKLLKKKQAAEEAAERAAELAARKAAAAARRAAAAAKKEADAERKAAKEAAKLEAKEAKKATG